MSAATATILTGVAIGATAGTSIYSATKQAGSASEAAKLQKSSTDQALAYEKERDAYARSTEANRYGAMMSQTAPFVSAGQGATGAMSRFLGLPAPASAPAPNQAMGGGAQGMGVQPGGAMITMRAPDGTTKQVPADQENHWVQKGAQRVG